MLSGLLFLSRDLVEFTTGRPPSNGAEIPAWIASRKFGVAMTSEILFFALVLNATVCHATASEPL